MQAKHTELPWKIARASKPDNTGGYDYALVDGKGKLIAEFFEHVGQLAGGFDKRPARENAEFVVRCVNRQPIEADLLAALKSAEIVICSALDAAGYAVLYADNERDEAYGKHVTIKQIRAAIARAEEV